MLLATLDPGEALAGEVQLYQEHSPFVQGNVIFNATYYGCLSKLEA